jgi:hypothetical protein
VLGSTRKARTWGSGISGTANATAAAATNVYGRGVQFGSAIRAAESRGRDNHTNLTTESSGAYNQGFEDDLRFAFQNGKAVRDMTILKNSVTLSD